MKYIIKFSRGDSRIARLGVIVALYFILQYYYISPHPPQAVPLLPRRRLLVYHPSQKENEVCSLILFSITDNPHPLSRAIPLTEPSPGEKVASE